MATTSMDRELTRLLTEGRAAAKRGDKAMARALLTQLVEKEPRHEEAWIWLSGVVTDPFEQQICLENALVINPANAQARKGLEYIAARTGATPNLPDSPGGPDGAVASADTHTAEPAAPDISAFSNGAEATGSPFGDSTPFGQMALPADGLPPWAVGDPEFAPDLPQEHVELPTPDPSAPAPAYSAPMLSPEPAPSTPVFDASDMGLPLDAQPFVVPGDNAGAHASDDGIPDWLGSLTPSVQVTEEPQYPQTYAPFNHADFAVPPPSSAPPTTMVSDLPDAFMGTSPHMGADDRQPHTDPSLAGQPSPQGPFVPSGAPDLGPMGPYTELQMPAPDQLPGGGASEAHHGAAFQADTHAASGQSEQPWYLRSNTGSMAPMPDHDDMPGARPGQTMVEEAGSRRAGMMVDCPNCRESVPDTSLACPSCRYSFFVNCPFCHELVDTSDAKPGVSEPCPYCQNEISKMDMGLGTINEFASQKNPGSRPGMKHSDPKLAFPSMNQQVFEGPVVQRRPAMAWVVDAMWLVAIIVMVWALTQLPTWMNLPGQY